MTYHSKTFVTAELPVALFTHNNSSQPLLHAPQRQLTLAVLLVANPLKGLARLQSPFAPTSPSFLHFTFLIHYTCLIFHVTLYPHNGSYKRFKNNRKMPHFTYSHMDVCSSSTPMLSHYLTTGLRTCQFFNSMTQLLILLPCPYPCLMSTMSPFINPFYTDLRLLSFLHHPIPLLNDSEWTCQYVKNSATTLWLACPSWAYELWQHSKYGSQRHWNPLRTCTMPSSPLPRVPIW